MKYSLFTFLFLLLCCKTYIEDINNSDDVKTGKKYAEEFYDLLLTRNREKIFKMTNDSFNIKEAEELLDKKDTILGRIIKVEITDVQTKSINNNGKIYKEFNIVAKVSYQAGVNKENLQFVQFDKEEKMISLYEFNPE
jgi:hypothetical protein